MPYAENYDQQTRRRKLTNAVVPSQGLIDQEGMDDGAITEFASRRAGELEKSYRAKDLERGLADIDAAGALNRRQQMYEGEGEAQRFIGAAPGREQAYREQEWQAGPPHQRRLEEIGKTNEGRLGAPYLNYRSKVDANDANRYRTRAQYGDPDKEDTPEPGIFSSMMSGLVNRLRGGGGQTPAAGARPAAPAAGARQPAAGPAADAGAEHPGYSPEELVGELKRAYPDASPRDLVAILNEEADGDPEDIDAATRLLLGLGR